MSTLRSRKTVVSDSLTELSDLGSAWIDLPCQMFSLMKLPLQSPAHPGLRLPMVIAAMKLKDAYSLEEKL